MRRSQAALAIAHRRALYIVSALTWLSGVLWLYLRHFGQTPGEFGPQPSPAQAPCLKIHGAAAMAFLIVLGSLLPSHVPVGWRHKRQRPSGGLLLAGCAVLVATGWGLYYVGQDQWREGTSVVHSVVGFGLPILIALHVWLGQRKTSLRAQPSGNDPKNRTHVATTKTS